MNLVCFSLFKDLAPNAQKMQNGTGTECIKKSNPRLSRKMSEFLRTCLRQVGAYLDTPGLLTTRKCKHARHIQRIWPLF